jgi:hypothetical protein
MLFTGEISTTDMLKLLALFFNVQKQLKHPPCTCNRSHERAHATTDKHPEHTLTLTAAKSVFYMALALVG